MDKIEAMDRAQSIRVPLFQLNNDNIPGGGKLKLGKRPSSLVVIPSSAVILLQKGSRGRKSVPYQCNRCRLTVGFL